MSFRWLKQYMPRSLYGRAALILVLPVVTLQLVVSVVFIQRHLEDVTTQMTLTVVRELRMIAQQTASAPDTATALQQMQPFIQPLNIQVRFLESDKIPDHDQVRWYDFSGRVVNATLRKELPNTLATQFPDNRVVRLYLSSRLGDLEVRFGRRRVTAAAPHQLIVTMVFFSLLMTLISFIYMRNQLRPITRLARAAEAFGRGHTVPYSPAGATELRIAGNAFLDMRARIERHIEQRTQMLSGVSHDLRTPLTRLKLGLSMLEDEPEATLMLGDVDEMQDMLDAFLEFSKGASVGAAQEIDPQALVQLIVADAKRAGTPVELVATTGQGTLMLRPVAMRRAVQNLLSNAVRYGSRAEISVRLSEKSLRIRVEDDGPGIPLDQRNEAIKPFTRLDPARNQNQGGGIGLGLAIVTDIARAHGGVLRLGESETLGGLRADIVIGR